MFITILSPPVWTCRRHNVLDLYNQAVSNDALFQRVLYRPNHVLLQYLLQDREPTKCSLRSRTHAKELIQKTPNLNNCRHQWINGLSPHFLGQLFLGNLFLWLSPLFVCALQLSLSDKTVIQRLLLVTLQQLLSLTYYLVLSPFMYFNQLFHVNGLRLSSHSIKRICDDDMKVFLA